MGETAWRVFAIRFAHREHVEPAEVFHRPSPEDGPVPMAYYVWVIQGSAGTYLLDTGFEQVAAGAGGLERVIDIDLAGTLGQLGVDADAVTDVFLSHLHFDHTGGIDRFPRARFWLQESELAFWTGPALSYKSFRNSATLKDLQRLLEINHAGRVRLLSGDAEVADGVAVRHVGGHTPGSQALVVDTGRHRVVLAADAAHYTANLERDVPYSGHESVLGVHRSFDRLRTLAGPSGTIVPGHDPAVMSTFAAVAGFEGTVVELTHGPVGPIGRSSGNVSTPPHQEETA